MGNFIKIYSLMYYFNLLHFIALTEPAEKRAWGGVFYQISLFGKKSPKDANSCPSKLMIFGLHEISLFMNCE